MKELPQEKYNRWWLGQFCRLAGSTQAFRLVTEVKLIGPPSFVYGCVQLIFRDGKSEMVRHGDAFTPRKSDVEVKP